MRRLAVCIVCAAIAQLPRAARAQQSASDTVAVQYAMAVGSQDGYEEASIEVVYGFAVCAGEVKLWYKLDTGRPKVGQWYRFKGERHLVVNAPPKVNTVDFTVQVKSAGNPVRVATIEPSSYGGGICTSINTTLGSVKDLVGDKATKDQVQRYLDSLELWPTRIQRPLFSEVVDSELRRKEQEAKNAANAQPKKQAPPPDDKGERDREEELRRQQASRANEQNGDATRPGAATTTRTDGDTDAVAEPDARDSAVDPDTTSNAPVAAGPTAEELIAENERQREQKRAKDNAENKQRRAKTEWTEADEHDTEYWPPERCMWVDSEGFLHPPYGKHRCDPELMKWVLDHGAKQREEEQQRLAREQQDQAFKKMLEGGNAPRTTGNTSAPGSSALSSMGTAGSGLAGAAAAAAGGSESTDRFDGGPSVLMPFLVLLEGTLFGGLAYGGMVKGLGPELGKRLDARAKDMAHVAEYQCSRGDDDACDEQLLWKRAGDPSMRARLPWTATALLGPGVSYAFTLGYAREHRAGPADPRSTATFDGTLHGVAIDLAWRTRFVRANVGYHALRGNLFAKRSDDLEHTGAQGLHGFSMGLALQPGWSQLISPYIGIRHRVDIQSGKFADEFDGMDTYEEGRIRSLDGGRTFGTLGVSIAFPPSFRDAMFKSWVVNLELYSDDTTHVTGGFMVTLGRQAWAPSWITELPGITTSESATQQQTWALPYIFTSGAGLKIATFERRRLRVSVLDVWLGPNPDGARFGTAGLTVGQVGPLFRLPGFDHAVSLTMGAGLNFWTRDEVITVYPERPVAQQPLEPREEHVRVFGFGAATLSYRAKYRNYTAEAGVRFPLVWWEQRQRNKISADPSFFAGSPPGMLYLGFGY